MRTYRIVFGDLDQDGNLVYRGYIEVQAHSYQRPRPSKHIFYDENGEMSCQYYDSSIMSVEDFTDI